MTIINEQEVLAVIKDALNLQEQITLDTTRDDVEAWDSLGHLGVLAALDAFFHGKVGEIKEIGAAQSVREIVKILKDNALL